MGHVKGACFGIVLAWLGVSCTGPSSDAPAGASATRADPDPLALRPSPEPARESWPPTTGALSASLPRAGKVRGRIFYEPASVPGMRAGLEVGDDIRLPDRLRGLPGAVVIVLAEPRDRQSVGKSVRIVDPDPCGFRPRITAIQKGAPLRLTNAGRVGHFVSLETTMNRSFAGSLAAEETREILLTEPEAIPIVCATHRGRKGWIVVTGSPFYAVTGPAGGFRIGGIPPGEHPVRIWHESFGAQIGEIRVEPGGEAEFVCVMSGT